MDTGDDRSIPRCFPRHLVVDLDEVRAAGRAAAMFEFDKARAAELRKIDLVELEPGPALENDFVESL